MAKEKKRNPGKLQKEYLPLAAKAWNKHKKEHGITSGSSKSKKTTGGKKAPPKKTANSRKKKQVEEEASD